MTTTSRAGAVFHRCALQVNPQHYLSRFRGQETDGDPRAHAEAIVAKAAEVGVSVLAVTNHNDVSGVAAFRDAAKGRKSHDMSRLRGVLIRRHPRVEFKRDDIRPVDLAEEMAALLNHDGGYILLGVEKDQTVSGLTRDRAKAEEWVMEVARSHLQPATNPSWEAMDWDDDKVVGIVSLPADAPDKPYKVKRGSYWITKTRVGTSTRDATREEEQRLYRQSGNLDYGLKPVPGSAIDTLDIRRLRDYFVRVLDDTAPSHDDPDAWMTLLSNLDLRGPMTPLYAEDGMPFEPGLVDQAWDFVRRNTSPTAWLEGPRRIDRWEYPEEVIREAVANALIHRDYSIAGTDVMLVIYSNRLEIVSPGRLPNTVTPAGMKLGARYARNQLLVNVMRDYGYVDARGMGVRNKIVPGMREHNGTEPDLIEEEYRFTIRLWKEAPRAS